jgi:hypothetical protein
MYQKVVRIESKNLGCVGFSEAVAWKTLANRKRVLERAMNGATVPDLQMPANKHCRKWIFIHSTPLHSS